MKSLYLILAAAAVVVTCEPQRTNNDIIWYPVDDEEGVFISTFGEKRRTSEEARWRSHRRVRQIGMEPPALLSYDPTENRDPSFFHNINERRPYPPIPKVPPSFLDQGNANQNFQEIFNEVFDYNKYPPASEYPGGRPGTPDKWNSSPGNQNQWVNPTNGNGDQWGMQRPGNQNQWVNPTNGNGGQWGMQRPGNQWETTPEPSSRRPSRRPTSSSWIGTTTKRQTNQNDKLVFPDEASSPQTITTSATTTPSNLIPTDPPTMSPCERQCPVTPEFNPVCGTDGVTYSNAGRLKCSNMCGKNVRLSHYGNCGRTPFSTPLVSQRPKRKFRTFWLVDK